jgi:hypothetical protein
MPPTGVPIYLHFLFLQNLGLAALVGLAGAWFGHYVVARSHLQISSAKR